LNNGCCNRSCGRKGWCCCWCSSSSSGSGVIENDDGIVVDVVVVIIGSVKEHEVLFLRAGDDFATDGKIYCVWLFVVCDFADDDVTILGRNI